MRHASHKVKFQKTYVYEGKRRNTYYVRWTVEGAKRPFKEPFHNSTQAENYRGRLMTAASDGELFDLVTGEPVSWARANTQTAPSVYDALSDYVDANWPDWSGKHRANTAEAFTFIALAMLDAEPELDGAKLRRALRRFAFNSKDRPAQDDDVCAALKWVAEHSRPVTDFDDEGVVADVIRALTRTIKGKERAEWSKRRQTSALKRFVDELVARQYVAVNLVKTVKGRRKRVAFKPEIDRRRVMNPDQARRLLDEIGKQKPSGPKLKAYFATMYYAGLRPEEAVDLRVGDLALPSCSCDGDCDAACRAQWGELHVTNTAPEVGAAWTDSGHSRDERGLKGRDPDAVRPVPCPPALVTLLRAHLTAYRRGPDDRVFASPREVKDSPAGILPEITCRRVWHKAREAALTTAEAGTPVARVIYDLRHTCLSTWLNAGVPAVQVAEWAGNSVEVLLSAYAKCIDGQDELFRRRIAEALGEAKADESPTDPEPDDTPDA